MCLESPTGKEQKVTHFLKDYLQGVGFRVELQKVDGGRYNVYARVGEPVFVFSTHTDTVSPYIPFSDDGEFIHGRGACDAKGIIAVQIKTAEKFLSESMTNFGLLFIVGEEGGSDGARAANVIPNRCRFLINGEPTENKLAVGSKGALRVELVTRGRSAHSAYPEKGESAIIKLLDILNDLRRLPLPKDELLGETTLNIGTMAGGTQANVIPDQARAELMFRTATDTAGIKKLVEKAIKNQAEIHYGFESDPICLEAVEGFETTVVSFATDIPLLTNWGKPFLLGPGSILDAHSPKERVSRKELIRSVDLYAKLVKHLLNENSEQKSG